MSTLYNNDLLKNLALLKAIAKATFVENPVLQCLCVTQALLECGLTDGTPSVLALVHKNLFGMKPGHSINTRGTATPGVVYMDTNEYVNGNKITVKQPFLANAEIEDSFNQYKNLINLPRYEKVKSAGSLDQAAYEIRMAGYATDPAYTKLLIATYNKYVANVLA